MLTPQDIQNKSFEKAVFGGYDATAVDDFLEEVTADMAALQKENAILKGKIKVLVEKVEEYRSTEDAMRMALLTAQKMGDDMIEDVKKKSQTMLTEVEVQAQAKKKTLEQDLQAEEAKLAIAKDKTHQYVESVKTIMMNQVTFLNQLDQITGPVVKAAPVIEEPEEPVVPVETTVPEAEVAPAEDPESMQQEIPMEPVVTPEITLSPEEVAKEDAILDAAEEIDSIVSKLLEEEPDTQDVLPQQPTSQSKKFRRKTADVDWSDDDELTSPRPKFDFENLQFGANYFDD